jgi:WD40 repeat protein
MDAADAAPPPSAACVAARGARAKATELDRGGHTMLALAKIDEANATCPTERAQTASLELAALANVGLCARVKEIAGGVAPPPNAKDASATCDAREAASKGTLQTMRAKMREAYAAERAKDYAHAKSLYLDAWVEQHPNTRAIEDAARMATLAGDAADARRLRDRALAEAEATEHATARVTESIRVPRGSARLIGTTLLVAREGKVIARDTTTGAIRVMVDATGGDTTLSNYGTLAFVARTNAPGPFTIYDVLTGTPVFHVPHARALAASSDDKLVAVADEFPANNAPDTAHVLDAATGDSKATFSGKWSSYGSMLAFSPDDGHVLVFGDDSDTVFRQWDIAKNAYTSLRLASAFGVGGVSANGRWFAYLESEGDNQPLHVVDMTTNKEIATWKGNFHSVQALAITSDGKTLATGSYSSLRLWDVAQKKQTFVDRTSHDWLSADAETNDPSQFAFSDDDKTMLLGGRGIPAAWDVATGKLDRLVTDQPAKAALRIVPAPGGGVAILLSDEVRILSATGEPRTVCKGMQPEYFPMIGPTNIAFSSSGKSFACVMSDGWVHVLDAATWAERTVVKKGAASPIDHPVDLAFSSDEKTLTVTSNTGFVSYDAATAAPTAHVTFHHASLGLAPRHARFDDGSVAVRLWNGSAAIFGADGAWQRDVKLVASAPIGARDEFSSDGKTYAVAIGKTLHVVDLATGEDHTTDLASAPKSLAIASDGKILVAFADGAIAAVSGGAATPIANAHGTRVWSLGKSIAVASSNDTIELFGPSASSPISLEVDPDGVVARDATGAFDARGKPELECVVGKTILERETCADRASDAVAVAWIHALAR